MIMFNRLLLQGTTYHLVIIAVLLLPQPLMAAPLTLILVNKVTGEPVEDATVVLGRNGSEHKTTNAQGKVSFKDVRFPIQLKILAIGYAAVQFPLNPKKRSVKILLTPLAVESEGLEVVADRILEKASKITLNHEEITTAPGGQGDALKVIQSLPGVVTVNGNSGMMYIRGSSPENNGVWINTLPVGYLYHWGGLRSTLNPALVEDFNLFLGGYSVEYMDRLGGMLDIRLRAPRKDRFHQRYSIGTFESSFLIEGPIGAANGNDSFYIAARRSYIDLFISPDTFNSALGNEDKNDDQVITVPRFYDAQALWRHELSNGTVELQYFSAGDELKLDNRTTANSDPELVGELSQDSSYQTVGLTWQQQWGSRWSSHLALSQGEQRDSISVGTDADTGLPYFADSIVRTTRFQPELSWLRGNDSDITSGMELTYIEAPVDLYIPVPPTEDEPYYDFTGTEKHREISTLYANTQSLFIKQRQAWTARFSSTVGLRYSQIAGTAGISMSGLAPRIGSEYRINEQILFTASWGRYYQMPSGEKLIDGFGTPGLEFTEAEHRILGIQYQPALQWSMQMEAYHKPMKHLVVRVPGAEPGQNYANRSTGEAYGFDLLIKRQQQGRRMGWLSYSWGKSIRTNKLTGEEYPSSGDQPHTLTLVWKQPMPGFAHKWDWGIKLQAASGKPYTPVTGRTQEILSDGTKRWRPIHGELNSARLPDYFSLDLRIDRKIPIDNWTLNLYLELQNITRHENVIRYDFGNSYQNFNRPKKVTGLPFMPFFGITATF